MKKPSLSSRLLGKRKASAPAAEQPATKRSTVESPREFPSDTEMPTASISDKSERSTGLETSEKEVHCKSTQSESGDGPSCSDKSDSKAAPAGDALQNASNQQSRPEPELVTLVDSDTSDEVDICEAPALTTPRRDTQVTDRASPKKPASPINLDSSLEKDKSPVLHLKPPVVFTKHPAASGSSSNVGIFYTTESKYSSPVPCHYCPKTVYQSAVKTCLVCGASMCSEHLRPHLDSPVFQNHTLVPAVDDISPWRCQEHQEINRIYCRQCVVCVCTVCTVIGSHRGHVCISIREAERELRVSWEL